MGCSQIGSHQSLVFCSQVTVVGVSKETFEPGVKVAMVFENTVAQKAGRATETLISA